jgi:hypothetical protein
VDAVPAGWVALLVVTASFAGCTDVGEATGAPQAFDPGSADGLFLDVLIVDTEFFPVVEATVVAMPGSLTAITGQGGSVRLGPLAEGDYTIVAEKAGYAPAQGQVLVAQAPPERMVLTLTPVASDVPFHITHIFMAYIFCTVTLGNSFLPCAPLNVLTGENITQDRAEFNFRIPQAGLADLLHEMVWLKQATGVDMSVTIRPPGAPLVVGGVTVIYLSTGGGSPLRNWVVTGVMNTGATKEFDANESTPYTTILRGRSTNSTANAMSLYNRPGPRDFTVIPDG